MLEENVNQFFATARERYNIKLRREAGEPPPWTFDPHFKTWRFCNVHREDDKTTVHFRENVRNPLKMAPLFHQLRSAFIYRWFNRIETNDMILDLLRGEWNTEEARRRLEGWSPLVTGAFMVSSPAGCNKLDGILWCIDTSLPMLEGFLGNWGTAIYGFEGLKGWWKHLKTLPYMGGFMAYELVSDLRWTPLLDKAPDIMTWANPGPGAQRGLSWLTHDDNTIKIDQDDVQPSMQELLARAGDSAYWPKEWRSWEMREVEHWLCEYDKWERSNHGQSQKRRYSY